MNCEHNDGTDFELIDAKESQKILGIGNTFFFDLKKNDSDFPKEYVFGEKAKRYEKGEMIAYAKKKRVKREGVAA